MNIPIPVGLIALGVAAWEFYAYGDWLGPLGIAVMYFGYWISRKCQQALERGFVRLQLRLKAVGVSQSEIDRLVSD